MAVSAREIFEVLSEWPHRGTGSEEEFEAREQLSAKLAGEWGVEVGEEGFITPRTYLPFFWTIALGQAACVLFSSYAPFLIALGGFGLFVSHFLFFDWRVSRLIWMLGRTITANMVAKKGTGRRLVILMAHLDSAPASYAYRADQVSHFKVSVYVGTALVSTGMMIPLIESGGLELPYWLKLLLAGLLVAQAVMASIDHWRFGFTPGANDNLTGVAAASEAASRLWAKMPDDTEVRLVITSAEEAGMLGAQHYWEQHHEELKARETHVLNFDTVGYGKLAFVTESGGFTPTFYDTPLAAAARALTHLNKRFEAIGPARHHVGDFDSVWFVRDGISSLTLAAYDENGMMPRIHTMDDTARGLDMTIVEEAAAFGEAIIRTLPTRSA